jgi:hypothetical protein
MKGIILLNHNENLPQVEEEEKSKFVRTTLEEVGIPLEGTWDENGQLSVQGKIKLRSLLGTFEIEIIDNQGEDLQIYHQNNLIGEWRKPRYVLKEDYNARDPRKKFFLEMHIDFSSIFETDTE